MGKQTRVPSVDSHLQENFLLNLANFMLRNLKRKESITLLHENAELLNAIKISAIVDQLKQRLKSPLSLGKLVIKLFLPAVVLYVGREQELKDFIESDSKMKKYRNNLFSL